MPYCYTLSSETQTQSTGYQTSASGNTEIDFLSMKAGSAGRDSNWYLLRANGRGSQLTALTGLRFNVKLWTTAMTTGTSITPTPNDRTAQACKSVWLIAASGTSAVSGGSGGPTYRGGFGCGASGPGGWTAATPDAMLGLEAGYAGSLDVSSIATPAVSFAFDLDVEFQE